MDVIVLPEARIHEDKALPGFNQEAERAGAQTGGDAGVAGEAVEEVEGQGRGRAKSGGRRSVLGLLVPPETAWPIVLAHCAGTKRVSMTTSIS